MKLTEFNVDYVTVTDTTNLESYDPDYKIHLIKLKLNRFDFNRVMQILSYFRLTKRFVIDDFIGQYNTVFKNFIDKKYYVENTVFTPLITFLRKNNKVLLNVNRLKQVERAYVLNPDTLKYDVLRNVEVVLMKKLYYDSIEQVKDILDDWNGNLIFTDII